MTKPTWSVTCREIPNSRMVFKKRRFALEYARVAAQKTYRQYSVFRMSEKGRWKLIHRYASA